MNAPQARQTNRSALNEASLVQLHMQAYNALGRARTHLLRHGAGNTQQAIAQAEHAIAAMAALHLMSGRA